MTETPTIHQALNAVMRQVTEVRKSQRNNHFGFEFRGIEQVMEETAPWFREHGVIGPLPKLLSYDIVGAGKDAVTIVQVEYTFVGPAGDSLTAVVPGEAKDTIKAMSIALRTVLIQVLHIPVKHRDADAPAPMSAARAKLLQRADVVCKERGWDSKRFQGEYSEWAEGAEIAVASDSEIENFLRTLEPKQTMQRGRRQVDRA